jgi:hypothetical protein
LPPQRHERPSKPLYLTIEQANINCATIIFKQLDDALGKAVAASEIGGGRLIVVDAVDDEAKAFYEHYHFVPVRKRERRLVMKVSTAAKALGERWRE